MNARRWTATVVGFVGVVPALALWIFLHARYAYGHYWAELGPILRVTALFAGFPAALTFGGLGRVAVRAEIKRGLRHGMVVCGRAGAVAGVALLVLATVPTGRVPFEPADWIWPALVAMLIGATAAVGLTWWIARGARRE